jgi:magnesium transporter
LELFSKLGYYFISFRAIESRATREKIQREAKMKDSFGTSKSIVDEDGSVGEANVYLTVFKDGICCVWNQFSISLFP